MEEPESAANVLPGGVDSVNSLPLVTCKADYHTDVSQYES